MTDTTVLLIHEVDEENTEESEVFARVESIGQSEFFAAQQSGLRAQYKIVVWESDYTGEGLCEISGKIYSIYRTYNRPDGRTELYLGEKVGTQYGQY